MRTFNLMKYLKRQGHRITLATLQAEDVSSAEIAALEAHVDSLAVFPRPVVRGEGYGPKLQRLATFALSGVPPSVAATRSAAMQGWVNQQIVSGQYEAITCEHSVNEVYVPETVRRYIPRVVVNIHSSVYGTCAHQLAGKTAENPWRDRINLPLLKRYEQRYCQKFSDLVVTTLEDRHQIAELSGQDRIHVIPNGVDLTVFTPRSADPGGHRLVFIGAMDNLPNIDAVTFLATSVFPQVRAIYPEARLTLVGARPTAAVQALADLAGVTVTGKVPEMTPYLHGATVCVVPMRTGYGIKNKTLEAMAAGVPVVASDRGLEGLAVDGNGIPERALRANSTDEFVAAISKLFDSPRLRANLSARGRELIEQTYTWEIAGKQYETVLKGKAPTGR